MVAVLLCCTRLVVRQAVRRGAMLRRIAHGPVPFRTPADRPARRAMHSSLRPVATARPVAATKDRQSASWGFTLGDDVVTAMGFRLLSVSGIGSVLWCTPPPGILEEDDRTRS